MQAFSRTPRSSRTRQMGLAGAAVVAASTAEAGMILSPTAVVSNSMGEADSNFDIGNVIDQSGLSGSFASGTTDYSTYLLTSPTHTTSSAVDLSWASTFRTTTGSIVFDLGDQYNIERLAIWQRGSSNAGKQSGRGLNGITLETSSDLAFTSPSAAGSFNVPEDAGVSAWPVNDFDLTDSAGRYVRLTIDSNHVNLNFTTFGELAFDVSPASAAVPEPTSVLLMLLAAGFALVVKRMRKPKPATTSPPFAPQP